MRKSIYACATIAAIALSPAAAFAQNVVAGVVGGAGNVVTTTGGAAIGGATGVVGGVATGVTGVTGVVTSPVTGATRVVTSPFTGSGSAAADPESVTISGPSANGGIYAPRQAQTYIEGMGYRVRYTPRRASAQHWRTEAIDDRGIDHIVDIYKDGRVVVVKKKERLFSVTRAKEIAERAGFVVTSPPTLEGNAYAANALNPGGIERPVRIFEDGRILSLVDVMKARGVVTRRIGLDGRTYVYSGRPTAAQLLAEDNYGNLVVIDIRREGLRRRY